ncbi:MAG TPA: DegT/DnrJ/EryC1/StrS family aminotransferase [Candidatus Methylacidiphilales bacterium]|nr:DegT/DnrJ/EryC1/StrS family aminotransferase [Candidatus Methylacidiphilales bacterium]
MKIPLLDVVRQNKPLEAELKEAACRVVVEGRYINGPDVSAFEQELSAYCSAGLENGETAHIIACASGSDALIVAFMALDLQPGDEVITTPYTFFATTSCLTRLGLVPVYVDIEPGTFNINVAQIEAKITSRTRAILPVHLYGQCADMDAIMAIAKRHGLMVVEDAAQSLGAQWQGRMAGAIGHLGIYSFYPSKNLGGFGDGGALVTRDAVLADKMRVLCAHGSRPKYHHHVVGVNSRLDTMQAALLRVKLRHLDSYHAERLARANEYQEGLLQSGVNEKLALPVSDSRGVHVWNQYCIRYEDRDALRAELTAKGIGSEIYYPIPLHMQKCFEFLGYKAGEFPVAEEAARTSVALPIFGELSREEIAYVVAGIRDFVGKSAV